MDQLPVELLEIIFTHSGAGAVVMNLPRVSRLFRKIAMSDAVVKPLWQNAESCATPEGLILDDMKQRTMFQRLLFSVQCAQMIVSATAENTKHQRMNPVRCAFASLIKMFASKSPRRLRDTENVIRRMICSKLICNHEIANINNYVDIIHEFQRMCPFFWDSMKTDLIIYDELTCEGFVRQANTWSRCANFIRSRLCKISKFQTNQLYVHIAHGAEKVMGYQCVTWSAFPALLSVQKDRHTRKRKRQLQLEFEEREKKSKNSKSQPDEPSSMNAYETTPITTTSAATSNSTQDLVYTKQIKFPDARILRALKQDLHWEKDLKLSNPRKMPMMASVTFSIGDTLFYQFPPLKHSVMFIIFPSGLVTIIQKMVETYSDIKEYVEFSELVEQVRIYLENMWSVQPPPPENTSKDFAFRKMYRDAVQENGFDSAIHNL
jgi:hypothetical protein